MSIAEAVSEDREAGAPTPRRILETVLARGGAHRAVVLQARADELARHIRRLSARSGHTSAPGEAASQWLKAHLRQSDDRLKRAAIAAMALGLERRVANFPPELRELYPDALTRLASGLRSERAYADAAFARDAALVSGLAVPVGALNVFIPDPNQPEATPLWAKRAATGFLRHALQFGPREASDWLAAAGVKPWAELHLDTRALEQFTPEGMVRSYLRLSALMRARPDLAGLYGASWLYDPRVAAVSPRLAFVRRTAEDGGGRIVRLKIDPVQTAFATTRSPTRRQLVESGLYRPACYAMYWSAADLIAWAQKTGDNPAPDGGASLQVVRK